MEAWAREYVGIPFRVGGRDRGGCDCWGLVRLVIGERRGVWLPSLGAEYETINDRERIEALVGTTKPLVAAERLPGPEPFAVVVLRILGRPVHVGLVLDREHFIHVWSRRAACVERFASPEWARRIEGFYRVA